jgi:hypothetical protein
MRSGIIQPFNVVSQNPVAYARQEINPFIKAIRPTGSGIVTMDGGLGIVNPEVIRTISGLGDEAMPSPGELQPSPVPYADYYAMREKADKYSTHRWMFLAGGLIAGLVGGWAASKLL